MKTFLSCGSYGSRPLSHRSAYLMAPGWLFLELGSWTLEVEYSPEAWPARVFLNHLVKAPAP